MGGKVLPLPSDKLREARAEGIEQGIMALINTCNALKATKDITLERLKLEFSLTDEQANENVYGLQFDRHLYRSC